MKKNLIGSEAVGDISEEFDRSSSEIADCRCSLDGHLSHRATELRCHAVRRRLLDDLLMPALQRAVALEQVDRSPVRVGEHLELDVACFGQEFLDEQVPVAKAGLGLTPRCLEGRREHDRIIDAPHAPAAAGGACFDQYRVADLVRPPVQKIGVGPFSVVTRDDRDTGPLHQPFGVLLETHRPQGLDGRSYEYDARFSACLGECRIFTQETVARVNRFGTGSPRDGDDPVDCEIALRCLRRAEPIRFIGKIDMQSTLVRVGIDCDAPNAHAARSLHYAAGDLAAVCDENLPEHCRRATHTLRTFYILKTP